jgi:hypothetical protein
MLNGRASFPYEIADMTPQRMVVQGPLREAETIHPLNPESVGDCRTTFN